MRRARGRAVGTFNAVRDHKAWRAANQRAHAMNSVWSQPRPQSHVQASLTKASTLAALSAPRIAVEHICPSVDGGLFPARGVVGQTLVVEADVFMDGHELCAARVLWRLAGHAEESSVPMRALGNDRWRAEFTPMLAGRYGFAIEAWLDRWGSYRADLLKRAGAGLASALDVREGRAQLSAALQRAASSEQAALQTLIPQLRTQQLEAALALLLSPQVDELMRRLGERQFVMRSSPEQALEVERLAAGYASWYELFPRSQGASAAVHGTFDDVIARLPAISAMGFDVLYLPPIHPIGHSHRKGRNNSLSAAADDPGSPYAIGDASGGHEAVHPQLGGIEAFRRLRSAAALQGIELALDLAVHCSRDHPWLSSHPGWFAWRADGSIRFAENPPKKYEDIVNFDFYAEDARPALWLALRDVVAGWVQEGVRIFRVDNPHTKPLPFWEWLIAQIRASHPEVIFLAEAFTRPAMMYRLAKIGFSQSYSYFTWRNSKRELTEYFTELALGAPADFYRPQLFVNTPDINPWFLHDAGRPGFLIRAGLAATLSGLWGLYSGFELCESAAVPGREEYLDSEKYQLKPRDWTAPGNIIAEISRLNSIRRLNPALQTHRNLRFYNAWNEQVLYFGKFTADLSNFILVAISLDPRRVQETLFEAPLWEFGLPDEGALQVEELMRAQSFVWHGKLQHWRFVPQELPLAIFRIRPLAT
jgi:starch synthase (maltosyl-transferring)